MSLRKCLLTRCFLSPNGEFQCVSASAGSSSLSQCWKLVVADVFNMKPLQIVFPSRADPKAPSSTWTFTCPCCASDLRRCYRYASLHTCEHLMLT